MNHELVQMILVVCPIVGVSMGDELDKATWRIDFIDGATEAQRVAAMAIMQAASIDDLKAKAAQRRTALTASTQELQQMLAALIAKSEAQDATVNTLRASLADLAKEAIKPA